MGTFQPVDARAIANILLAKGMSESVALDPMKLLKITYIAHGWTLGLTGKPLFQQAVYAWPYGPVIPDVYRQFKRFGHSEVDAPAVKWERAQGKWTPFDAVLDDNTTAILDRTWLLYKPFTGKELSALTHAKGTPWAIVTEGKKPEDIRDILIPELLIQEHYRALAQR